MRPALLFLLFLWLCPIVLAQETGLQNREAPKTNDLTLPDKPVPHFGTVSVKVEYAAHPGIERLTLDVPHKTADRAWVAWNSVTIASTGIDLGLALTHLGREANPMVKNHPVLMSSIAVATVAGTAYVSHKLKRQNDAMQANGVGAKATKWWVVNLVAAAPHVVGIGWTLANAAR